VLERLARGSSVVGQQVEELFADTLHGAFQSVAQQLTARLSGLEHVADLFEALLPRGEDYAIPARQAGTFFDQPSATLPHSLSMSVV